MPSSLDPRLTDRSATDRHIEHPTRSDGHEQEAVFLMTRHPETA